MDERFFIKQFKDEGYVVVPALYSAAEVASLKAHFHGAQQRRAWL